MEPNASSVGRPKKAPTKRFTVYLRPALIAWLQEHAEAKNTTLTAIGQEAFLTFQAIKTRAS